MIINEFILFLLLTATYCSLSQGQLKQLRSSSASTISEQHPPVWSMIDLLQGENLFEKSKKPLSNVGFTNKVPSKIKYATCLDFKPNVFGISEGKLLNDMISPIIKANLPTEVKVKNPKITKLCEEKMTKTKTLVNASVSISRLQLTLNKNDIDRICEKLKELITPEPILGQNPLNQILHNFKNKCTNTFKTFYFGGNMTGFLKFENVSSDVSFIFSGSPTCTISEPNLISIKGSLAAPSIYVDKAFNVAFSELQNTIKALEQSTHLNFLKIILNLLGPIYGFKADIELPKTECDLLSQALKFLN